MDELKDLVIQSLETKGVLGQLRAQLRSCVFKCIDEQDATENQGRSQFHWENPHAKKATSNAQGMLGCELIREFLEFYKMDYTLNIFGPETNLQGKTADKADLARRAKLDRSSQDKPILLQILEQFMQGDYAAGPPVQQNMGLNTELEVAGLQAVNVHSMNMNSKKPNAKLPRDSDEYEGGYQPKTMNNNNLKGMNMSKADSSEDEFEENFDEPNVGESMEDRINHAKKLIEEDEGIQKSGYHLDDNQKQSQSPALKKDSGKKSLSNSDISDNYQDDFDDDIEEDIASDQSQNNPVDEEARQRDQAAITGSAGYGVTVSQSLGVDPSVDSLALEDYDHVEPVERLV